MDMRMTEFATVLVVEDEKGILDLLGVVLSSNGFNPILVRSGEEAVDIFRQQWERIAIVLMDVQMPGLDGPETLGVLREINPGIRCCFMSGHPGQFTEEGLREMGPFFIWKPFRLDQLLRMLRNHP